MLAKVRRLMEFELSLAELIGVAEFLVGPYLLIGLGWICTHGHSDSDQLIALGEASVLWPVLAVLPTLGCAQ